MKIEQRTYEDFRELQERPLFNGGRRISLILPARHEHKTIAEYFPQFARLFDLGCIDEIVIADSSDNMETIDTALKSAMDTEPFSREIDYALRTGGILPVKAVNVFDSRISGLFNGHKPIEGTAPGKGTAMYLGMAVATGDILLFLDTDFKNIDPRFVYGLAGPFEDPRTVLSKATFELEDTYQKVIDACGQNGQEIASCDLLLKSVVSRTLAKPMMGILDCELGLFPGINGFNGPLSGGCGASKEIWQSLRIPIHYGIEVSYLMQLVTQFPNGRCAYDVNLGEVAQESQDAEGRVRIGENIINTILHEISRKAPELYRRFVQDPRYFTDIYLKYAAAFTVHNADTDGMELYSTIMQNILAEGTAMDTPILPALNKNVYYLARRKQLLEYGNRATAERIQSLTSNKLRTGVIASHLPNKVMPLLRAVASR